jgi:glyoxalase family protein
MTTSNGLHHITAIAGEPKRHVAFYTGVIGLRLVKRTVNFDVPNTWHLYYGDETGNPGTALTFFVWEHMPKAEPGRGEAQEIAFSVPTNSLEFWRQRLSDHGYRVTPLTLRFGEPGIATEGPDGHKLEFIGVEERADDRGWANGDIPAEHAIRGFHGVTVEVAEPENTARILTQVFGFVPAGREANRLRFRAQGNGIGTIVDLRNTPGLNDARAGVGSVHHIAFRAANDDDELQMRSRAIDLGMKPTEPISRKYFHSIYFREPEGVLFEIATDGPGFTVDEPAEALGRSLKLPPWHEPRRAEIEAALPALE